MTQLFSNNASALLAASINNTDTTIQVAAGFGTLFPNPGASEDFRLTLENSSGDIEIVRCTSRSTDLLTVVRGQEGTSAQSWTAGQTRVEVRLTKGTLENFLQKTGGEMSGDLDMNANDIIDAILSGSSTKITAGEIVNVPLRGATGVTSNQILVPTDGSRATAGGAAILCAGDDLRDDVFAVGMIVLWYGSAGSVPSSFQICDGTNGTPDLRGRFVIGVSGSYAFGTTGGSATLSGSTSTAGSHTHAVTVAGHALTENELPAHNHRLYAWNTSSSNSTLDGFAGGNVSVAGEIAAGGAFININGASQELIEDTGGGQTHTHTASTVGDGAHSHTLSSLSILPPYRALYYIMRV